MYYPHPIEIDRDIKLRKFPGAEGAGKVLSIIVIYYFNCYYYEVV